MILRIFLHFFFVLWKQRVEITDFLSEFFLTEISWKQRILLDNWFHEKKSVGGIFFSTLCNAKCVELTHTKYLGDKYLILINFRENR